MENSAGSSRFDMASFIQKLLRSFTTTLFYIWTVIQALLSLRSPVPFPFRETSAVVPCPVETDLERGMAATSERCAYSSPASSTPITHRDAIQKVVNEDRMLQGRLKSSLGLSSEPSPGSSPGPFQEIDSEFTSIDLTIPIEKTPLPTTGSPDPPKRVTEQVVHNESDLSLVGDLTMDPFLDVKPIAPLVEFPFRDGRGMEDVESLLFTLPLCTSTPPRSRKGGKDHRRGALVTISQPKHLNESRSSVKIDSLLPPTTNESVIETPSARRQRTLSLRRSVAFDIFDSSPPAWSTPKRPAPSIVVLDDSTSESSSSPDPTSRPTTPLRIVKRNKIRSSTTSEVSKAVISAVRDAFVAAREEHEDDAASDPRDILCRASVWTCNTLSVDCSTSDTSVYEDDEAEDEYTQESGEQVPATPPPPYAFSDLNTTVLVADGLKASTIKAFLDMKRCSISSDGSTELGLAVAPGSPLASVDSCLDDLLASFESLMTAMPELQPFVAKTQTAKLLSVAGREQIGFVN